MIAGIDFDTYRIVACAIPHEGEEPYFSNVRYRRDKDSGEDFLFAALIGLGDVLRSPEFAPTLAHADVVFVERGYGGSRRSDFTLGCVFGALLATLPRVLRGGVPVNPMNIAEWKRVVTRESGIGLTKKGTGNGNVKKPIANEATRTVARGLGLDPSGWTADECDAYAIAYAGRDLNARAAAIAEEALA